MMKIKLNHRRASYMPVLLKIVQMTTGPILELGAGLHSTPYLHWACYAAKRKLVTLEDHPDWWDYLNGFKCDYHNVHCVIDWNVIDLSEQWDVAFVDHDPIEQKNLVGRTPGEPYKRKRYEDVARLTHAQYVICHDAENSSDNKYGYSKIANLFKYRWKYSGASPYTAIFSNFHDVSNFKLI